MLLPLHFRRKSKILLEKAPCYGDEPKKTQTFSAEKICVLVLSQSLILKIAHAWQLNDSLFAPPTEIAPVYTHLNVTLQALHQLVLRS